MSGALIRAWENTIRLRGDARALIQAADGKAWTFREIEARSASWMAARALVPGALAGRAVVFAEPNGIGWLEVFIGLLRAGAVAVPLDAGEPRTAQHKLAEALRAAAWWDGLRLSPLPRARRYRDPDVCLTKLTSGSTGRPRPLAFTARQLLADGRQVATTMGIGPGDTNYALIPFGHSYGLGNLVLPLLASGVPVVCGTAALPHAIAADFERFRPTLFPSVPVVWRALAASGLAADSLASLRLAVSAGAPLSPEVAREFAGRFGRRLHGFYGSSETGGIAFDRSGEATLKGGVGRPLRGVRVQPVRGDKLCVCSAAVFTQGNRHRSKGFGCWMPPDRVSLDARGRLTIHGRIGATVKIAGRRVNLAEVTARLRRLPGVQEVWVGVGPGADGVLGAAVASGRTAAELREALLADTAAWRIPKKWAVLPSLPLTSRGKLDTRALHARLFG